MGEIVKKWWRQFRLLQATADDLQSVPPLDLPFVLLLIGCTAHFIANVVPLAEVQGVDVAVADNTFAFYRDLFWMVVASIAARMWQQTTLTLSHKTWTRSYWVMVVVAANVAVSGYIPVISLIFIDNNALFWGSVLVNKASMTGAEFSIDQYRALLRLIERTGVPDSSVNWMNVILQTSGSVLLTYAIYKAYRIRDKLNDDTELFHESFSGWGLALMYVESTRPRYTRTRIQDLNEYMQWLVNANSAEQENRETFVTLYRQARETYCSDEADEQETALLNRLVRDVDEEEEFLTSWHDLTEYCHVKWVKRKDAWREALKNA